MRPRPARGAVTLRRLLLLAASFSLAATGWFLLGESEPQTVAETPPRPVLARVAGVDITESEVAGLAAAGLAELDRQRRELILETTRSEVHRRLLETEAARRGITPEELLAVEAASEGERYDALIARLEKSHGVEYLLDASPAAADAPTRIAGLAGR